MAHYFRFGSRVLEGKQHAEKVIQIPRYEHGTDLIGLYEADLRPFSKYQLVYDCVVLDTKRFFYFICLLFICLFFGYKVILRFSRSALRTFFLLSFTVIFVVLCLWFFLSDFSNTAIVVTAATSKLADCGLPSVILSDPLLLEHQNGYL